VRRSGGSTRSQTLWFRAQTAFGRFQASYWNEGIRHVGEDTFPTKTDAFAYLSTVETDLRRGTWIDPEAGRKMFADLADGWLVSNPVKRSSTMQRDEAIVRNHLLPALGSAAVGSITRVRIQDLVNVWATDRAARTVRRQFDVLRAIFAYAVATDALLRSPCRGVKLPAVEARDRHSLTPGDVLRIADATPEMYRPMVWIGAVLGLRWGEVAGLQVRALDFVQGTITVATQLGRDGRLGPPKSAAGRRVLGHLLPSSSCSKPTLALGIRPQVRRRILCLSHRQAAHSTTRTGVGEFGCPRHMQLEFQLPGSTIFVVRPPPLFFSRA